MNAVDISPHCNFAFLRENCPLLLELADHIDANLKLRIVVLQEEALILRLNLHSNGRLENIGLLVVKKKSRVGLFKCAYCLLKDREIGILGKHLLQLSGKCIELVEKCLEEDATRCHCVY